MRTCAACGEAIDTTLGISYEGQSLCNAVCLSNYPLGSAAGLQHQTPPPLPSTDSIGGTPPQQRPQRRFGVIGGALVLGMHFTHLPPPTRAY